MISSFRYLYEEDQIYFCINNSYSVQKSFVDIRWNINNDRYTSVLSLKFFEERILERF